jgi:hypothetical protein
MEVPQTHLADLELQFLARQQSRHLSAKTLSHYESTFKDYGDF